MREPTIKNDAMFEVNYSGAFGSNPDVVETASLAINVTGGQLELPMGRA